MRRNATAGTAAVMHITSLACYLVNWDGTNPDHLIAQPSYHTYMRKNNTCDSSQTNVTKESIMSLLLFHCAILSRVNEVKL